MVQIAQRLEQYISEYLIAPRVHVSACLCLCVCVCVCFSFVCACVGAYVERACTNF